MVSIAGKISEKGDILSVSLAIIFGLSVISVGLFYEWLSCVVSVALIIWLLLKREAGGIIVFRLNLTSAACALIVAGYTLSIFWAIDRGMALVGFLKLLPVPLFLLCIYSDEKAAELIKKSLPVLAAVITLISAALMQIPALESYFSVAGRLAGTFQYPNTFALFLLVAELLAFKSAINKYLKAAVFAVLIFGLLYTGSRTVIVLAVLANIAMIALSVRLSKRTAVISVLVFMLAVGISAGLAFGGVSPFNRILTINLSASTFVGRMLYFKDAVPVIIKHPVGLGYLGYFYTQTTFQTGVYSVKYLHNDILQLCLDIGWIPAIGLIVAIFRSVFLKGIGITERIILSVMFLHCLFDFDLQFTAIFMLLFLFLKKDEGKTVVIARQKFFFPLAISVLAAVSVYFSVALGLSLFGKTKAANSMYSLNTDNQIKLLISLKREEGFEQIADSIIERNPYVYVAYGEKARAAYKKGDFGEVIKYKNLTFEYAPLVYDEYEEYIYMLINGVTLYSDTGDKNSAEICKKQILATEEKFDENFLRVSELGMQINDKPKTEFPEDIEDYIKKLKGES